MIFLKFESKLSVHRTLAQWNQYFCNHQQNLPIFDGQSPGQLTELEKARIADSVRSFQLGESSEGFYLMKLAREDKVLGCNPHFTESIRYFIREENRHALTLGLFLKGEGIALAKVHWTDALFRKFRRLLNLEVSIRVLLTAELIANVYYKALGEATQSLLLIDICNKILQDELEHAHFHWDILSCLKQEQSSLEQNFATLIHQIFFSGTIFIVFCNHFRVLTWGENSGLKFWRACWAIYHKTQP